jgi:alpha-methylacyl-CoA racemase
VGAIEPQFYGRLLELLDVPASEAPQWDRALWPELKERFAAIFRTRTRDEWAQILDGEDACATPVLGLAEAPRHPHLVARETFVELDGVVQPAAAPRFERTPGGARPAAAGGAAVLNAWGICNALQERLLDVEVLAQPSSGAAEAASSRQR